MQGAGQQSVKFHQHSPEAATCSTFWTWTFEENTGIFFRAFFKKWEHHKMSRSCYSHTGYTHIYGSAEGNSLLVLTEKNKSSFVNVYEGGWEGHLLTKANKSSTDICILAFTFVIHRHSI